MSTYLLCNLCTFSDHLVLFTTPWCTYPSWTPCLHGDTSWYLLYYYILTPPFYSCGQTKPSNLLTDFLGLQKALELVDNGINGLLLISLINSNQQNFQKWWFKGFIPQKFGMCLKKIVKNMRNVLINFFLFLLSDPIKIFAKYSSEISQQQWEICWNCHVDKPFPGQVSHKKT